MPDIFHQLHPAGLVTGPAVILVLLASVATGSAEIITSAVLVHPVRADHVAAVDPRDRAGRAPAAAPLMDVPPGFDPTVILWLNLAGTFVFGLSGGLAAVHARLDFFGVLVLAAVVGLAGGVMRDLLIGVPPATFRDWEYLAVVAAAGLVSFFAHSTLERIDRGVQVFDAIGLSVFCVTGATKAITSGVGPVPAVLLGAITGIGGGILRDVLLNETPTVLRQELYAIPALLGAAFAVTAEELGSDSAVLPLLGAVTCFAIRMLGVRRGIDMPTAPPARRRRRDD